MLLVGMMMKKFEYKKRAIAKHGMILLDCLNREGEDGWQAVCVDVRVEEYHIIMMREKE